MAKRGRPRKLGVKNESPSRRRTIHVPDETWQYIEEWAKQLDTSEAAVIRRLIAMFNIVFHRIEVDNTFTYKCAKELHHQASALMDVLFQIEKLTESDKKLAKALKPHAKKLENVFYTAQNITHMSRDHLRQVLKTLRISTEDYGREKVRFSWSDFE